MPLHTTLKTHAPRVCPDVHPLTLVEPIRQQLHAHRRLEPVLIAHLELDQIRLGRHALGLVVPEHGRTHIVRALLAAADLHRAVAVPRARLVRDHLALVHLQDRAGHPLAVARVVPRHALLGGQHARAQRRAALFAPLRGRWRCGQLGEAVALVVLELVFGPLVEAPVEGLPADLDAAGLLGLWCEGRSEGEGGWLWMMYARDEGGFG